jgi:hypothetical protein
MGPPFSNEKTVSSGTAVHRDLTHEVRSCGQGAEARGRPECAQCFCEFTVSPTFFEIKHRSTAVVCKYERRVVLQHSQT